MKYDEATLFSETLGKLVDQAWGQDKALHDRYIAHILSTGNGSIKDFLKDVEPSLSAKQKEGFGNLIAFMDAVHFGTVHYGDRCILRK